MEDEQIVEEKTDVEKVRGNLDELKEANDAVEKELLRSEQLRARVQLGGKSEAGQKPIKKSEDEVWAEDAKKRYEGTGLDPTPDETPTTYL